MNGFIGIRRVAAAAVLVFPLLPAPSHAGGNPLDEGKSMGAILSHGAPTDPINPSEWRVKVSPGLIENNDTSDSSSRISLHGWGASASITRGLGDHWGVAFIAGGNMLSGGTPVVNSMNQNIQQAGRTLFGDSNFFATGDTTAHGVLAAAGVIWNHWTGDGFQLPIIAGLSYFDMSETSDYKSGGARADGTLSSPGVYLGLIPQFKVWKVLRVAPFITFSDAFSASHLKLTKYNPSTGATIQTMDFTDTENSDNRQTHTFGIALSYIPWGLGFTYIPNLEGITAYTLTFNRKFGGAAK